VNQGTARIVIIVALVVVGAAVLANGFDTASTGTTVASSPTPSSGPSAEPTDSPSSSASESPAPKPQKTGVAIMALNGTTVPGLGAAAQELLKADGYVAPVDAADAPNQNAAKTVVYYRTGTDEAQNQADARFIAKKYFGRAKVQPLASTYDELVPPSVTVVIVTGQDFADAVAAG
jgi:hypothetical protein